LQLAIINIALLLSLVLGSPCLALPAAGQDLPPVLELGKSTGSIELGSHVWVMETPDASLTPGEAASSSRYKDYRPMPGESLARGYTESVFWFCFRLRLADKAAIGDWLLDLGWTRLYSARLYVVRGGAGGPGQEEEISPAAGQDQGWGWRHPSFHLSLESGRTYRFYLRLIPYRYLLVQPRLNSETAFLDSVSARYLFYGFYYGVILAMILYNLMAYYTLGDRNYLWYVIYVGFFVLYMLSTNGILGRVLPPLSLSEASRVDLIFFGLMFTTAAQVVRSFLDTRRYAPLVEKLLLAYMTWAILLVGVTPFLPVAFLHRFFYWAVIGPVLAVWASIGALRRGFKPAGYFLAAWLVLGLGAASFALTIKGLLPSFVITNHALQISSVFEVALLSLALAARIKQVHIERQSLAISEKRYRHLSQTDELTGLYNKRYLMDWLEGVKAPFLPAEGTLSLVIMDVDDFKAFNDAHGHQAGDQVLITLARVIDQNARQGDIACRFGGEEFIVILPGASAQQAQAVAERIRKGFESQTFALSPGQSVSVTVSLGVAQLKAGEDMQGLLERADQALYLAKDLGKNRTEMSS
jgi:diguanylate cyclase (GGDEF)-like protein